MKILVYLFLFFVAGCQMDRNALTQTENSYPFYVGTYTNSESRGIYKFFLQENGSLKPMGLVAKTENPAFLTISADRKYLLAVNEIDKNGTGTVESYLIKDDSLKLINSTSSGGAHPCFISVNESGFVLAANYTGGSVGLLRLNKKGELSPLLDIQNHNAISEKENQQSAHAHSAWFEPFDNSIISVDKGTNDIWFSKLDTAQQKLIPSVPQKLQMDRESGPRHLVIHPNAKWIYVLNELNNTVTLIKKTAAGNYLKDESVSTLPNDYQEKSICADIAITADAKFIYASNRGHNSIAIFEVNESDGFLNLLGHQSSLGEHPRNIALSPDENFLLVANRRTNNIVSFKRDKKSGLLTEIDQDSAPTPACIVF